MNTVVAAVPGWALATAHVQQGDVLMSVHGPKSSGWWPPVLILTGEELCFVSRGWMHRSSRRVPLTRIASIGYSEGAAGATMMVNVSGEDTFDGAFTVGREQREQASAMVDRLREMTGT
jgi:hypothetical protein